MKLRSLLFPLAITLLFIPLESFAAGKIALKVLYAGHPGSAREKDFVMFLEKYVATVGKADLKAFTEDQAKDYDVVIFDYDGPWKTAPRPKLGPKYSKPTMTVGMVGSIICKELKLKTAYFWNCLTDAAHGESVRHEIFMKPMKVTPVFQVWPTPPNYRKANPRLPAKIRIFKIQKTSNFPNSNSKPEGNVSQALDFKGVKNAEILVYGVSTDTKGPDAAVARHGNFLQWGYSAPPSKMTREGLKLFLNSLVYIKKFDGKRPWFS